MTTITELIAYKFIPNIPNGKFLLRLFGLLI